MESIKLNEYTTLLVEESKDGYKLTCMYDGVSIGYKDPCWHLECLLVATAEMALVADQMHRFEKVFEPEENQN